MTLPRNALATALIAVCSVTGLTACGSDSLKVSDAKFITKCTDIADKNPRLKAYGAQVCKCVQGELKAKGLGDKEESSSDVQSKEPAALKACGVQAQGGK